MIAPVGPASRPTRSPLNPFSKRPLSGTAVNEQLGTGDKAGILRSEEDDDFRKFSRAAETARGVWIGSS
jgi:hypothetical protein